MDAKKDPGSGDYLSQVFNNINWESRVKPTTNRSGFLGKEMFDSSFAYKYMWYKMEPEQIDFDNPFDVEEGNLIRPKLKIKNKKAGKGRIEASLDMLTEHLKEVKKQGGDKVEEEEDDFLDEYGNIIPDYLQKEYAEEKSKKRQDEEEQQQLQKAEKSKREYGAGKSTDSTDKDNFSRRNRVNAKDLVAMPEYPIEEQAPRESFPKSNKRKNSIWIDLDEDQETREDKKLKTKSNFDFEFPRLSSLNGRDQRQFLQLHKKYLKGELYGPGEAHYLDLLAVVQEERMEFTKFSHEYCQDNREQFDVVLEGLDKYVTEHRESRKNRVLKYPRYWRKMKEVRLGAARREQGDIDHFFLGFQETVLQRGKIPLGQVPKKTQLVQMPSNYSRIVNKYPANPSIMPGTQGMSRSLHRAFKAGGTHNPSEEQLLDKTTEPSFVPDNLYMHNMSVIEDPNAAKLAAIYTPDVIMSASALKCIMDNFYPGFSRAWEIPVFVQEIKGSKPADTKRVIFIGKPFISKQVTACDRNKLGLKYSQRTWMNKDWNTLGQNKPKRPSLDESRRSPRASPDFAEPEEDFFNASLDELESFGGVSDSYSRNIKVAKGGNTKVTTNEDLSGKVDGEADASIAQVDGTISSLSYRDLDLKNVNLLELLADPNNIIFDPDAVDVDDKLFTQLDGAASSDDEELMIDLGDQEDKSGHLDKSETPGRKKVAEPVNAPVSVEVEETKGRRSTRLRAQKTTPKQKEEATPQQEQEITTPRGTRTRTRSGRMSDAQPAANKKAAKKEKWLSYTGKEETNIVSKGIATIASQTPREKDASKEDEAFKKPETVNRPETVDDNTEAVEESVKVNETETVDKTETVNKTETAKETAREDEADINQYTKESQVNSKQSKKIKRRGAKRKNDPASKNTHLENDSEKDAEAKATVRNLASLKPSAASQLKSKDIKPESSNILDSLLSGQSALHGKAQANHQKKEKSTYKGEDMKIGAPCIGSLDQYLPPFPGNNYSYSLWNLLNKNTPNSSIRIMIRSKIAGLDPYFGPLVPSVKLEYQTSLGAEQSTVSECCREWCDNLLRPSSTTVRYRIDPQNGKLLMTQKLSLNQIREEGMTEHQQILGEEKVSSAKFDPSIQLANLHNLVTELKVLSAGNYLLSHDKKSGAFCRLYKQSEGEGDYDLHESYSSLDGSQVTPHIKIPWKQIDYNLLTPWHVKNDRVPGTFAPASSWN